MTENKPINTCEFFDICVTDCGGRLEDAEICSCYELYKQLSRKTQECEELKLDLIEAKAHGDYLNNLALSETLNLVNEKLDQLKAAKEQSEQKLERIRELLTNITEAGLCEAKECGCDDNKECLECTLNEIKDVIQIIDEVK